MNMFMKTAAVCTLLGGIGFAASPSFAEDLPPETGDNSLSVNAEDVLTTETAYETSSTMRLFKTEDSAPEPNDPADPTPPQPADPAEPEPPAPTDPKDQTPPAPTAQPAPTTDESISNVAATSTAPTGYSRTAGYGSTAPASLARTGGLAMVIPAALGVAGIGGSLISQGLALRLKQKAD